MRFPLIPDDHRKWLSWSRERFGAVRAMVSYLGFLASDSGYAHVDGVWLRPKTTDRHVYDEVFRARVYEPPITPRTVIDAGAQIGLTSVFLARAFPAAQIIAIEPDAGNFTLLEKNTAPYPNVRAIRGAVWHSRTTVSIRNPEAETWSYQVGPGNDIPTVTIGDLIKDASWERLNLLKIDVEGSEIEVFSTAQGWVSRVDSVIIELHDRYRSGCSDVVLQALAGFVRTTSGMNDIFVRPGAAETLK